MNREKLKIIDHNMELLVNSLKQELQEPVHMNYEEVAPYLIDDDIEFYEEED
jgi:hypothetical protein